MEEVSNDRDEGWQRKRNLLISFCNVNNFCCLIRWRRFYECHRVDGKNFVCFLFHCANSIRLKRHSRNFSMKSPAFVARPTPQWLYSFAQSTGRFPLYSVQVVFLCSSVVFTLGRRESDEQILSKELNGIAPKEEKKNTQSFGTTHLGEGTNLPRAIIEHGMDLKSIEWFSFFCLFCHIRWKKYGVSLRNLYTYSSVECTYVHAMANKLLL